MSINNLGIQTERSILAALGHDVDGELKMYPFDKQIVNVIALVKSERQRAADIAHAIDSGRGNEKEIARAILEPSNNA